MWDLDHHLLPDSLASMFTRRNEIHNRNLRDMHKNKLYTAHRFNNRYGYDSFSHPRIIVMKLIEGSSILRKLLFKISFHGQV